VNIAEDLQELRGFVEAAVGPIERLSRSAGGASRITWFIEAATRACVLRVDPGDGPVANTALTLAREASAYRALAGSGVLIPELIAEADTALLLEMASGRPELDHLSNHQRAGVLDSYVDALAHLHGIDASSGFEALGPPAQAAEAALHNLALWEGILQSRVKRPSPLAQFASHWLRVHAPNEVERLVVCHGDVGPGNFMHDDARVTALLDWEFVHIGDPMDDLAWLAFRGHHLTAGIGNFDAQLERWSLATGMAVDRRRIAYYRITVMFIWLVSCLAALDNGARDHNRFTYINLISLLNVLMPRAMAEYHGLTLAEPELGTLNPRDSELSEQIHALADLVRISWPIDEAAAELGLITVVAQQIQRFSELHPAIDRENKTAVARLIGASTDLSGTSSAAEQLDDWLRQGAFEDEPVLQLLYGNGVRRLHADTLMKPLADQPLLAL
jgi:aminoglycoside phosphotransferase (APT) family kinase protein